MKDLGEWLLLTGYQNDVPVLIRKSEIKTVYKNKFNESVVIALGPGDDYYVVGEDFDAVVNALTDNKLKDTFIADPQKWGTGADVDAAIQQIKESGKNSFEKPPTFGVIKINNDSLVNGYSSIDIGAEVDKMVDQKVGVYADKLLSLLDWRKGKTKNDLKTPSGQG